MPIWKTRGLPRSLIDWDIFKFFFETAEQNLPKLDRKPELNVLYIVCVFRVDRKKTPTSWPPWHLIVWHIFDFFSESAERYWPQLNRKEGLNVLYHVFFCFDRSKKKPQQDDCRGLWLADTFLLFYNHWTDFAETWQEAKTWRPP